MLLVAALSLALTAGVGPAISDDPVQVQLDGDPAMERLLYHARGDLRVQAQVRDRCHGRWRTWRLTGYEAKLLDILALELDGATAQPEIILQAIGPRDELTDRLVKIVRFDQPDGACAHPRVLFRFHPAAVRNGTGTTVAARLQRRRHGAGRDLALRLTRFHRDAPDDVRVLSSRRSLYRYAADDDRFTRRRRR